MKRIVLLIILVALSDLPTLAQTDVITGMWRPLGRNEDGSGMDGDYAGLPLSAAGRLRAQIRCDLKRSTNRACRHCPKVNVSDSCWHLAY